MTIYIVLVYCQINAYTLYWYSNHDHQPTLILLGEDCIEGALEVMIFVKFLACTWTQPSTLNAPV